MLARWAERRTGGMCAARDPAEDRICGGVSPLSCKAHALKQTQSANPAGIRELVDHQTQCVAGESTSFAMKECIRGEFHGLEKERRAERHGSV